MSRCVSFDFDMSNGKTSPLVNEVFSCHPSPDLNELKITSFETKPTNTNVIPYWKESILRKDITIQV